MKRRGYPDEQVGMIRAPERHEQQPWARKMVVFNDQNGVRVTLEINYKPSMVRGVFGYADEGQYDVRHISADGTIVPKKSVRRQQYNLHDPRGLERYISIKYGEHEIIDTREE